MQHVRRVALGAFACLMALSSAASASESAPPLREGIPRARAFAKAVLELIETYPTDGTHKYWWPRGKEARGLGYTGTTCDLEYKGETVARGDGKGSAYCCGLTFEVFVRTWQRLDEEADRPFDIAGLTPKELLGLRRRWYVATSDRSGPQGGLVELGLGRAIEAKKARPGDFVQLWRGSGSGHSVIFLGWEKERGQITAIRYWSTQTSTDGIGINTEPVGGRGVDLEETAFVRVGR